MIRRPPRSTPSNSSAASDVYKRQCNGGCANRVIKIPMGNLMPTQRSKYSDKYRDRYTVLFFGNLRKNKGIGLLPEIARRVHKTVPQVKFIVAGSGKLSSEYNKIGWPIELENILNHMKSKPYFDVRNRFISNEEAVNLFMKAKVTIMPYLEATQSAIAPLAMSYGSIVLSTAVGDIPELVIDGKTLSLIHI